MKHKEDIKQELEGLSPFLSKKLNKKTGFETPRNYFHNLQLDIMQQVQEEIKEDVKTVHEEPAVNWLHTLKKYLLQPQYALAFSAIVAIAITTNVLLQPTEAECLNPLCDLTAEEASQFIEENIEDFSMDMILEVTANEEENINVLEGIEEEAIDEYLEEMMDEDESLIEELM